MRGLWGVGEELWPRYPSIVPAQARPNGLELSCPAARASRLSQYGILTGNASSNLPPASRVSCSELLGSSQVQSGLIGNSLVRVDG
jgi:hypothetical protein